MAGKWDGRYTGGFKYIDNVLDFSLVMEKDRCKIIWEVPNLNQQKIRGEVVGSFCVVLRGGAL